MTKVAILVDGAYLLKRLPAVCPGVNATDPTAVAGVLRELVRSHLNQVNEVYRAPNALGLLYRIFYYDARPYLKKAHTPVGHRPIDYAETSQAVFRQHLFRMLRNHPNMAVRLGDVRGDRNRSWILKPRPQEMLLRRQRGADDLSDADFTPALRQKGVDMRIGLDIATITLKRQAGVIVLVSGDADFAPAAKLARREGVQFVLDPLWQAVSPELREHIDLVRSGFRSPGQTV